MTAGRLVEYQRAVWPTKHILAIAIVANDQEYIPDVLRSHDRVTLE